MCLLMKMWHLLEHWQEDISDVVGIIEGEELHASALWVWLYTMQSVNTGTWWIGMIRICVAFRVPKYVYLAFKQAEIDRNTDLSPGEKDVWPMCSSKSDVWSTVYCVSYVRICHHHNGKRLQLSCVCRRDFLHLWGSSDTFRNRFRFWVNQFLEIITFLLYNIYIGGM